jgi:hypothetical protein
MTVRTNSRARNGPGDLLCAPTANHRPARIAFIIHNRAMTSQLPEWMRNPEPTRTTLSWKISQAWRRTFFWRVFSAFNAWNQRRFRISQRFPKTWAILTWFFLAAVSVAITAWAFITYSRITFPS